MIEALINPILADNFGLSLEFISYVFVMTVMVFLIANFMM